MPEDINNLDPEDIGLKSIMGVHFVDETAKKPTVEDVEAGIVRCYEAAFGNKKAAQKPAQKPTKAKEAVKDAQCEPVKPAPDFMDKLKRTAKDVCLYAVLSLILFWWQQSGRLEETTAWYALLVCVGMVFFTIGKNLPLVVITDEHS